MRSMRLNPCCNGICVKVIFWLIEVLLDCLNPCCNGICVKDPLWMRAYVQVGLNPCSNGISCINKSKTDIRVRIRASFGNEY